ncbi:MAG: hypothetical protein WC783_02635 [Candidatus Paceibacterota bacterium]|jgi:hypothetical protein
MFEVTAEGIQKIAYENTYYAWRSDSKQIIGDAIRITYDWDRILIEELPTEEKKKKLGKAYFSLYYQSNVMRKHQYGGPNLIRQSKIDQNDNYISAVTKLNDAIKDVDIELNQKSDIRPEYEEVYYLKVPPSDAGAIKANGIDFSIKSEWTKFTSYSPDSDLQLADPYYTVYESSSPTSARKLYKMLKENPNLLSNVNWNNLGDWFTSNGIKYEIHFSSWS